VEVDEPARRRVEHGRAGPQHRAVEDHRDVRPALVSLDEVDDLMAPGLLLAVAEDANIDGQLARAREQRRGLQEGVELPLVVGRAAGVEPAVPQGRLERRRLPLLFRPRRLDVEVPVDEHRRSATRRSLGRPKLADDERERLRLDQLRVAACGADEVAHPLPGAPHVILVSRIGADRRNPEERRELFQPGWFDLSHAARVYSPKVARLSAKRATRPEASGSPRARAASSGSGSRSA
jgi:hypothetical protein